MRILIMGGPGSGCSSTAAALSEVLGIPWFDTDDFFHKPSDPPFQEQYAVEQRRERLEAALQTPSWILSGSVATWGVELRPTHGLFLATPQEVRLQRLKQRERQRFGLRIEEGGDLFEEHTAFLRWAEGYESRIGEGRNLATDRTFCEKQSRHCLVLTNVPSMSRIVEETVAFLMKHDGND